MALQQKLRRDVDGSLMGWRLTPVPDRAANLGRMIAGGGKSEPQFSRLSIPPICPSGEVMTQQIGIDQTDAAVAGASPRAALQEISQSTLLYWWPAWAFGFVLPLLNAWQAKFLATASGTKPSSALDLNERIEIAERDGQRQAAELEAANARTELAERECQRLAAELEAAQARLPQLYTCSKSLVPQGVHDGVVDKTLDTIKSLNSFAQLPKWGTLLPLPTQQALYHLHHG